MKKRNYLIDAISADNTWNPYIIYLCFIFTTYFIGRTSLNPSPKKKKSTFSFTFDDKINHITNEYNDALWASTDATGKIDLLRNYIDVTEKEMK